MERKLKGYPGIITNFLNNCITGKIEAWFNHLGFNSPRLASLFFSFFWNLVIEIWNFNASWAYPEDYLL